MDQALQIIDSFSKKYKSLRGDQFFIDIQKDSDPITVTLFTNSLRDVLKKELAEAGVDSFAEVKSLESAQGPEYKVIDQAINLYVSPGITELTNLADQLVRGEQIRILKDSKDGEWAPVRVYHDYEGQFPYELGWIIFEAERLEAVPEYVQTDAAKSFTEEEFFNTVDPYLSEKSGIHYLLGGKTIKDGMDCSSFSQEVFYKLTGKRLYRQCRGQEPVMAQVDTKSVQIGDVAFFFDAEMNRIGHLGLVYELQSGKLPKVINCTRFCDGIVIEDIDHITRPETQLEFIGFRRMQ